MNSIGTEIRKLRKEKHLSQLKLGDALGIDRSVISRWESDQIEPTIEQLKSLCSYFEVSPIVFLEKKNQERKSEELLKKMKELF